jgi:hypothetical protein
MESAPLCPGCAQAQALIAQIENAASGELSADEIVATMPLLLESALAFLLADVDYATHSHRNAALAAHLLGVGAARAEALRVQRALR